VEGKEEGGKEKEKEEERGTEKYEGSCPMNRLVMIRNWG
jgi:hypothetical protein